MVEIKRVLNGLWLFVVCISLILILFGIVLGAFNSEVYLGPEDYSVEVEVVSEGFGLKTGVSFVLVGAVAALFLVTIILLIVLLLKRQKKQGTDKAVKQFNVFGVNREGTEARLK